MQRVKKNLFCNFGLKNCLLVLFFLLFSLLSGYVRLTIFRIDDLRTWTDTLSYVNSASLPVFSKDFWFGLRAPLLPLIYKLFGANNNNYTSYSFLSLITHLQFIFSFFAWNLLAFAVSTQFKSVEMKIISFFVIFASSLSVQIALWEKLALSESISNSLFLLLVSLLLFFPSVKKSPKPAVKIFFLTFAILISTLYCMIRDSNILLVAGICVAGLVVYLFEARRKTQENLLLLYCVVMFIVVLFAFVSGQIGNRSAPGLINAVVVHLDEEKFVDALSSSGIDPHQFDLCAWSEPKENIVSCQNEVKENQILIHQTRTVYWKYMLQNPKELWVAPFINSGSVLSPSSLEYRYSSKVTPAWVETLSEIVIPMGNWIYLVTLGLLLVAFLFDHNWQRNLLPVSAFLFFTVFLMSIAIYHSDPGELERHCQQNLLQSRLVFWMMVLWLVDFLPSSRLRKKHLSELSLN